MRSILFAIALASSAIARAAPVACDVGTIDFDARSYDPAVAFTTFNVGQEVRLTALPVGITPSVHEWTIDGPHIKDYEERIGNTTSGSFAWSTAPLAAADLAAASVTFYWKPDASQVHPLTGGAVTRNVTLKVTVGTTDCTVTQAFSLERSTTDINRQAEDFYTRNHRAPTETDLTKGRIIDDHIEWHTVFATRLLTFLPWHREFLRRFNLWRAEFGYPPTVSWYPGNPIPAGADIDDVTRGATPFDPALARIPPEFTIAGAVGGGGLFVRLAMFTMLDSFSNSLEFSWHGTVHCLVGGTMCSYHSPKDPLFFRWHGMIDVIYENFCSVSGVACPGVTVPLPPSDLWMADNATDLAANGSEPSSGIMWASPSLWNRTTPATCAPVDPVATVARTCGSDADHENPIAGVTNYLYATIRNDRPGAQEVRYAEVGVYVTNASTGLTWPTSFGGDPPIPLPETRQFITVNVPPGQVTTVGPLPWVPPSPVPSDHFCAYTRILSAQAPAVEVPGVITINALASNNVVYRNLQIVVNSTDSATFTVANDSREAARTTLRIEVPDSFHAIGRVRLLASPAVASKLRQARLDGIERQGRQGADAKALREIVAAMPRAEARTEAAKTPRERELLARIDMARKSVLACARGEKPPRWQAGRPLSVGASRGLEATREKALVEAIAGFERQLRACQRQSAPTYAYALTKARAAITGIPLAKGEAAPVTIEFSSDTPAPAEHRVMVIQEDAAGKVIGGNTYVVRTGTH